MKNFIRLAAVLSLTVMLTSCSALQDVFSSAEEVTPSKTTTSVAEVGDLVLGLSADGSITLPVTGLDFAVSGIIKNIYVETGDMVKAGDVLAELDDTDLQLALKTAQNNLEKAQLSYEKAVADSEYSLKSETLSLETAKEKLNETFDAYTYEQKIADAELSLTRQNQNYEDAVLSAQTSEDSARLTLERRQADLAEAQADLEEANADLADAQADGIEDYDDFTNQNNIKSAELKAERALKTLNEAKADLIKVREAVTLAQNDYINDKALYDQDYYLYMITVANGGQATKPVEPTEAEVDAAKEAVTKQEEAVSSAQQSYDDAADALELEETKLERDAASYVETEEEQLENAIESAQNTVNQAAESVAQAEQQVEDAQTSLSQTIVNNTQSLTKARQNVDDAEKALTTANEDLARGQQDFNDTMEDTQSSYDLQVLQMENVVDTEISIKNAQYAIDDAQNALEAAENNLAKTKIVASIDGEILNVTKKIGEKVTESEDGANMFMGSNSTSNSFVTIRDLTEIYMTASVPEGDIVGLTVGQKIRVEVDALEETDLSATVYSVSSIPTTDSSGIITYEIVGILDEFNEEIRDSMSVFLTFIKKEVNDVLLIPTKSVFVEDSQQYVYVQLADGTLEKRAVTCGFSNGTQTEVSEGLEAGETVVVGKVTI